LTPNKKAKAIATLSRPITPSHPAEPPVVTP
jgi:hypothetical protein